MGHLTPHEDPPIPPAPNSAVWPSPIAPYGGRLVDLIVSTERADAMKSLARDVPSLTLDDRTLCDLEQLAVGGYSPLTTFLGQADYARVLAEGRLTNGTLWPLPIVLPVTPGEGCEVGRPLALRDVYGNLLAFLHVEEIYPADKQAEAHTHHGTHGHYASGPLEVLRTPPHFDFTDLRHTPASLRAEFARRGWSTIVAIHTRAPLHRPEEEQARQAAHNLGAGLLLHPAVGTTQPGDINHFTRIRTYRALVSAIEPSGSVALSLLPLAPRHAGTRETLLHAILRRNYGCTHLIVASEADRDLLQAHAPEIGVEPVLAPTLVYLPDRDQFVPNDQVPDGITAIDPEFASDEQPLPSWFTRPAVAEILRQAHPPRSRQGLTLWFTGLSGSGKSTVAHALVERLAEYGRFSSFLDGDEIRTHLSRGLGFSREDRDTNIRRVGYVAGLVNQHGGTILCSVISPYRAIRDEARAASRGNFVEIYCATPIAECERRDVKGLYARARAAVAEGRTAGFTGVDDPYEPPLNPEVTLDTARQSLPECVEVIVAKLLDLGYLQPND
jgi:sulfate adenylyltransferase